MDIDNLSGYDFEDLTEELIKKLGFITEERKRGADGGIDIRAINEKPIFRGTYIIQCKRYSSNISEPVIRDLYGVVTSERANKGILITNSKFSKKAIDFARGLPIELIDGNELTELLEKNIGKKFDKEPEENVMPEKYRIVFEYLDVEEKRIRKRQEDIRDKKIYLKPKFYNNIEVYNNYFLKKFNKLVKISEVLKNQINNFTSIWNNFSDSQSSYKNIQELKNHCSEIKKIINIVENEREEFISVVPPDNLEKLHSVQIDIYNPIFNFFSEFLYKLSLTEIDDLEDPRIKKYLKDENGKQVIDMHFEISFDEELKDITRESEFIIKEIQRNNNVKRKKCYIATAIYEDENAIEVIKLRCWRDEVLSKIFGGSKVINFYYLVGPHYANLIKNVPIIKKVTKNILNKIINRLSLI